MCYRNVSVNTSKFKYLFTKIRRKEGSILFTAKVGMFLRKSQVSLQDKILLFREKITSADCLLSFNVIINPFKEKNSVLSNLAKTCLYMHLKIFETLFASVKSKSIANFILKIVMLSFFWRIIIKIFTYLFYISDERYTEEFGDGNYLFPSEDAGNWCFPWETESPLLYNTDIGASLRVLQPYFKHILEICNRFYRALNGPVCLWVH